LDANRRAIAAATVRARELGAEIAVASELALLGYPPRDLLERPAFVEAALAANAELARSIPGDVTLVFGSIDVTRGGAGRPLYNAALVARGGAIVERAHKRLLPTYDVFDEDRYFEPGGQASLVSLGPERLGLTVCEDAWNDVAAMAHRAYGERSLAQAGDKTSRYHANPVGDVAALGIDLILNVSASPFTIAKRTARPQMFAEIARRHAVPVAFVNQVGGNDELLFDGRSTLFGPDGQVLARARAFEEDLVVCDWPGGGPTAPDLASDEEAAYCALVMGTRDYARKCGFDRMVIGLSGGIDSALTATIAADAVGPANVLGVGMPSRYSSRGSTDDARALAENLGIGYREVSIEPMFAAYLASLEPLLLDVAETGSTPARTAPDVTFENVQARIRGSVLMAISNRTGALLLTTGNKSEIGVGYCTLYGDMAGGLAVISDVPKTMVYRLSRYVNRDATRIPLASIEKPPSAELRPDQKDQDSLPPYDLLDRVLERFVEDGAGRQTIVEEGVAASVVDRVISLVRGSEYKRRQAAPGLILTKKAFGVGRRMPIAQGFKE
ncbi:MAG TPA: NAD+ synthase, partial [Polyangiaceae bacterium]|nr:NAD+ synthase [Polyangiaceae bacterium]